VVERFFLRHVYRIALPYQLLLTFAFVLIFDNLVKIVWGGRSLAPSLSFLGGRSRSWGGNFRLQPVHHRCGAAVALGLYLLLERTWSGRIVRAASSDREMASAIGVRVPAFSRGLRLRDLAGGPGGRPGGPLRGAAHPGMGETIIIEAFIVAVIGGLGSLKGAFVGALVIGVMSAFGTRFFPTFDMFLIFILMAGVLLVRPEGLFGGAR